VSNFLPAEKLVLLSELAAKGLSTREIAKRAGISKNTVQRWIVMLRPDSCYCGKRASHKGWCWYRVAKSPARQAFLRTLSNVRPETERFWAEMNPSREGATAPPAEGTDPATSQSSQDTAHLSAPPNPT
jgi:hypothetical protein